MRFFLSRWQNILLMIIHNVRKGSEKCSLLLENKLAQLFLRSMYQYSKALKMCIPCNSTFNDVAKEIIKNV